MTEGIQRRVVGEPETIQDADGNQHNVQFELGRNRGQAIVVLTETPDSPFHPRGADGEILKTISDTVTREVHMETVEDPDDPAAVELAKEKIRAQLRGYHAPKKLGD